MSHLTSLTFKLSLAHTRHLLDYYDSYENTIIYMKIYIKDLKCAIDTILIS